MKYRASIIGVGTAVNSQGQKGGGHQIGYCHARMYQRSRDVQLESAADINKDNLDAFRSRFSVEHGFADYRVMLRETRPDFVSICTYVGLHRQMIEECAKAGVKAVFCEKPFVASPADLLAIRRIVEETGVKVVIAHVRRHQQAFDRVRQLVASGAIGQPVLCLAAIKDWDLSEWGSHWLDMFRFFHGDAAVQWVMGQARVRNLRGYGHRMEDHAMAYFQFEGGGKGLLDSGMSMNGPHSMMVVGTEATIRVTGEHKLDIDSASGRRTEDFGGMHPVGWEALKLDFPYEAWQELWDVALADLLAWVAGGPAPRLGLPNTYGSAELNLAAYVSAVRGDRVDLPLSGRDAEIDKWPLDLMPPG